MKRKIYIFGNPLVEEDSLPIRILPLLRKRLPDFEFVELDTVEELDDRNPWIIDTVLEAKDVIFIEDIDKLVASKTCTAHDYDLAMELKLLKKVKRIDSAKIFGVPAEMDEREVVEKLVRLINQ